MSSEGGISTVSLKTTPSTPFDVVVVVVVVVVGGGGGCGGRGDDGDADPVGVVAGDEASAPAAAAPKPTRTCSNSVISFVW